MNTDPVCCERAVLLGDLRRYVLENLAAPLSLAALAGAMHYSPSHLSRVFKSGCGENLFAYIGRLRLERAQKLLREGALPVGAVAAAVGFSSTSHFHHTFKKYVGMTPCQYRCTAKRSAQYHQLRKTFG